MLYDSIVSDSTVHIDKNRYVLLKKFGNPLYYLATSLNDN